MWEVLVNNTKLVKKQIKEDISELNICYTNKAYKSCLILAGSIMEAILIDWLSEIRGIDYFDISLKKRKYDKINHCYIKDKQGKYIYTDDNADLADYIDEIKDINGMDWEETAQKAHIIRKRRNLVHAKLCLRDKLNINDETCKEIIYFLKDIVESRWNK